MNQKCIEIATWPGMELPSIEKGKLCDKQHYDDLFSRRKKHMLDTTTNVTLWRF